MTSTHAGRRRAWSDEASVAVGHVDPELLQRLHRQLEEAGLSSYEARVLLGLMRLRRANTLQLARISGVPRTSIYPVLQGLEANGVVERLPVEGPVVWGCFGHDDVMDRLKAVKQEQLRKHATAIERLRTGLAEVLPRGPSPGPHVRVIPTPAQTKDVFERLFAEATEEILAFSTYPYFWESGDANPVVLQAVRGGLTARALYEASLEDPEEKAFRAEIEAYIGAGVQARVVNALPIKLVIADRKRALLAMTHPPVPDLGHPNNLLFEHPGFASLLAEAFELHWQRARPYEPAEGEPQPGAREGGAVRGREDAGI